MRRPRLRRLDLLCLGASPEKLRDQSEIPAVDAPALSDEQRERLYVLNYRHQFGRTPLSAEEQQQRSRLIRTAKGGR